MRAITLILLVTLSVVLLSGSSLANFGQAKGKFNRGLVNMVAFWIEIPYQVFEGVRANPLTGLPVGFAKSIYMMPARIGSGAVDFITFPVPFPVKNYESLVQPEYNPWITD